MEPYIGQLMLFAGNFAPRGWALCDGQLMSIAQNSALFSILGTTYGGDGITTFALPDLRGRVPLHPGTGPGLTTRDLGESKGTETVTLLEGQMPTHTHVINAVDTPADVSNPRNNVLATSQIYSDRSGSVDATLNANSLGGAGGSQPHENMQPFLGITFVIALEGIYPSRA